MSADGIINALDRDWSDGYARRDEDVRMDTIAGHDVPLEKAIAMLDAEETITAPESHPLGIASSRRRRRRRR